MWNLGSVLGEALLDQGTDVVVYPNPAQEFIRLQGITLPATMTFYNLYGSVVFQKNIESTVIDIRHLPAGMYLAVATSLQNNSVHYVKIQLFR